MDDAGTLVDQDFFDIGDAGVQVNTQIGLMADPLKAAGLLMVGTDALLETAKVPELLKEDFKLVMMQVKALMEVRRSEEDQRRQDRRDRGVSDDWPKGQSDSEAPF